MATKSVIFDPFPRQKQFVEAVLSLKYRYLLYGGGVGGGKTFAGLGTMLTLLAVYPGSKGLVIRDSFSNLTNTSIPSWRKLIQDKIGPGYFITRYSATDNIFYCSNGSQLQFIAEDYAGKKDMSHFFGLEINFVLMEECSDLQEQTFLKVIERTGRHLPPNGKTPPPIIMLTTNPTNNWVRQRFYDPWSAGTLRADYFYLPALLSDNKYLLENTAYVESTKANMPAYLYRKYFGGDWDVEAPAENRMYRCFDPDRHISDLQYNQDLPLHLSFDENVNPYMSLTVFQVETIKDDQGGTVQKNINLIKEICAKHPMNTVEGVCTLFKREFPAHRAGIFIYGDATSRKADTKLESGHNLYTLIEGQLKRYMPRNCVLKSNPSVVMRTAFFDAVFEKEFKGIRFRVDTKCNGTINDFIKTRTDSDGTKLKQVVRDPKTKTSYQQYGHLTDTCDYFLCSAFAIEFEQFKNGGRLSVPIKFGKNVRNARNRY